MEKVTIEKKVTGEINGTHNQQNFYSDQSKSYPNRFFKKFNCQTCFVPSKSCNPNMNLFSGILIIFIVRCTFPVYIFVPNSTVYKDGFHAKEEKSAEKQLSQLNDTSNDFVIGKGPT